MVGTLAAAAVGLVAIDLLLGYLTPERYAGGQIKLNRQRAEFAIDEEFADRVLQAVPSFEDAAVLDLMCGGRLEVGVGPGGNLSAFEAFGLDSAERATLLAGRKALAGTLAFFGFRASAFAEWREARAPTPALPAEEIDRRIAARDRMFARHPHTTFISLHVANWPEDLDYVSGLLDRLPNVVVEFGGTRIREVPDLREAAADLRARQPEQRGSDDEAHRARDEHAHASRDGRADLACVASGLSLIGHA